MPKGFQGLPEPPIFEFSGSRSRQIPAPAPTSTPTPTPSPFRYPYPFPYPYLYPIDKLYTQVGNVNRLHNIIEPFAALF